MMMIVGSRPGSVIWISLSHLEAPSTVAAS